MPGDLLGFFSEVPNEGYKVEGSHCVSDECSTYEGNIDPNNIWTFYLTSPDGKVTQKVETSILDFSEPKIRFSINNQGEKIALDISPENCEITKDGFLCIKKSNQDHEFKIVIKKS